MRCFLATALGIRLPRQASEAFTCVCNDNHYSNASGHLIHSPSYGIDDLRREAICRDGSVPFSEHRRGTCSHDSGVGH
jgi:hypothetical protein